MKLHNKTSNGYSHTVLKKVKVDGQEVTKPVKYTLNPGAVADIPNDIAKIWLKIKGIEEYVAPADLKEAESKAQAEIEALKKEVEAANKEKEEALKEVDSLKAEIEALKKGNN